MKIHQCQQGSKEWLDIRRLKLTASHAQAIGNMGAGLETYITEMLSAYHSSAEKDYYSGIDTERGHELEPIARQIYELETGNEVTQVGFVEINEFVGCSPDGLVGEDGGLEIKSPNDKKHYEMILYGEKEIESKYLWQVQFNIYCTGRKYFDLAFYNPNFKKSLITFKIYPDPIKQSQIKLGIEKGINIIKSQLNLWKIKNL